MRDAGTLEELCGDRLASLLAKLSPRERLVVRRVPLTFKGRTQDRRGVEVCAGDLAVVSSRTAAATEWLDPLVPPDTPPAVLPIQDIDDRAEFIGTVPEPELPMESEAGPYPSARRRR